MLVAVSVLASVFCTHVRTCTDVLEMEIGRQGAAAAEEQC
jgi:hypothetical protein